MNNLRLATTLIGLLLSISIFAGNNDITMVSYEQSWLDSEGTIALKNNTNKEIKNVSFQITYLDMEGNELDYEDFSKKVTIAPGKTKKLDIPAYEHSRNYHYYKTKDIYGHPAFKIKFKLKGYDTNRTSKKSKTIKKYKNEVNSNKTLSDDSSYNSGLKFYDSEFKYIIIGIVILIFALGIGVGSYVLVAVMAQRRNRNVALWILLSFIASPLLIIIILLCIGDENRES